jgi:hypothetical protein
MPQDITKLGVDPSQRAFDAEINRPKKPIKKPVKKPIKPKQ